MTSGPRERRSRVRQFPSGGKAPLSLVALPAYSTTLARLSVPGKVPTEASMNLRERRFVQPLEGPGGLRGGATHR